MDATKFKVVLSIAILSVGFLITPLFVTETEASNKQATGFLIDFGNWNITWTEMDTEARNDPFEALDYVCETNGYTYVIENETVLEINGVSANDEYKWDLWIIPNADTHWKKFITPYDVNITDYTIGAWAFCSEEEIPAVAVDQSGRSIYGYKQAQRTISLSPSITETIGSLKAVSTLVGTDKYSNYPDSVVKAQEKGDIKIIGDFLNPSFELIVGQRPNLVFCDGSQYAHYEMAKRLRDVDINAVVMYDGESIDTILSNIYIAGRTMGYEQAATEAIWSIELAMKELAETMTSNPNARQKDVMFALSPDKSPWIAGSNTYIDDISSTAYGNNVFIDKYGWVQINSELVMTANPACIIILTTDYHATQEEYDLMYNSLSAEWRSTDAYKNGEIYLICENAGEMSQRSGPRCAQLTEIIVRILHQSIFIDEQIPKFIGENYEDYLTFTKYLGFNN